VTAPAEGPATVTLTDDERALLADAWIYRPVGNLEDWMRPVERIVAARVAALTADHDLWRQHALAADQVIANVRALADEWFCVDPDHHDDCKRGRLLALLPDAPTGEQS
jgi:hypothetical protein